MRVFSVIRSPPRDALRRLTRRASNARESTWSLLRRASLRSSARYFGTRGAGVMASSRLCSLAAGSTVAPLPLPGLLSGTSSRSPVAVLLRSRPSLSLSCGAAPISSMRSARPRRRLPPIKRSPYRDHRAARQLPSCSHPYGYEKPEGRSGATRAMQFAATERHEVWGADVRHLDMVDESLVGSKAYAVTVMDNYSRAILASAVTPRQDLSAFLSVLYRAVERYGAPKTLVTDSGSVFLAYRARALYAKLGISKEEIEKGRPWQNYSETTCGIQQRMATGTSRRPQAGRNSSRPTTGSSRTTTPKATSPTSGARTAGAPRERSSLGSRGCASTRRTWSAPSSPSASLASWTPWATPP